MAIYSAGSSIANAGALVGAGRVVQVVQNTTNVATTVNSTATETTIDSLNVVITPTSSSNKIMIWMSVGGHGYGTMGEIQLAMFRDIASGTQDARIRDQDRYGYDGGGMANNSPLPLIQHYLDSPNTTAACTYHFAFKGEAGTSHMSINHELNQSTNGGVVVAFEITG